jgi:hypothetical protein
MQCCIGSPISSVPLAAMSPSPRGVAEDPTMTQQPARKAAPATVHVAPLVPCLSFDAGALLAPAAARTSSSTPSSDCHMLAAATSGRFGSVSQIGKGAYGSVLKATTPEHGPVAVKVIRDVTSKHWQLVRRSIRELLCLRRLRGSPNVSSLLSVFTAPYGEDGHNRDLYFTLDLCSGNLLELALRRRSLTLGDVQSLLSDLLRAVRHAHVHGAASSEHYPDPTLQAPLTHTAPRPRRCSSPRYQTRKLSHPREWFARFMRLRPRTHRGANVASLRRIVLRRCRYTTE